MKKVLSIILSLILVLGLCSVPVAASTDVRVTLDGEFLTFDVPAQIINDRTMVPMRGIFEALGATVTWNADTYTATGVLGNITINITIGEAALYRNGQAVELDVPAQIVNDRTLVPLRAIAQSFDCFVDWDAANYIAIIETTKEETPFDVLAAYLVSDGEYDAETKTYDLFFELGEYVFMWSYDPADESISLCSVLDIPEEGALLYGDIVLREGTNQYEYYTSLEAPFAGIEAIGAGVVEAFKIGEGLQVSADYFDILLDGSSVLSMLEEQEVSQMYAYINELSMTNMIAIVTVLQEMLEVEDLGISILDFGFAPQVI